MLTKIIIKAWAADADYLHVHLASRLDGPDLGALDSDVVDSMSVRRARQIGSFGKIIVCRSDGDYLRERRYLAPFVEALKGVSEYSPSRIAEARGALEDFVEDDIRISDDEVAFLDWHAREVWCELANEVDNPFREKQKLEYPICEMIEEFCPSPEPPERDRAESWRKIFKSPRAIEW